MTKVMYNGEEIELQDEFEKGFFELDLITSDDEETVDELEKTIELDINELENTKELTIDNIEDTQNLTESIGNINE